MATTPTKEIYPNLSFTEQEASLIDNTFEFLNIKKGQTVLRNGTTVNDQYFIYKGCLRAYFIDNSGKEHTLQFAIKDWWISDYTAYFSHSKALMNIECVQEAEVFKISRENMEMLFKSIPALETFSRKKMEGAFASFQKRILGNLSQSATERYTAFLQTYPEIEQSVKNYHIASFLGITTESLSRIRKEMLSH